LLIVTEQQPDCEDDSRSFLSWKKKKNKKGQWL